MIGLPTQNIQDIEKSLNKLIELSPEHISVYSLILEEGTPLEIKVKNKELYIPSDVQERNMYWKVKEELEKNGYIHYEISNFSKVGYESKHNLAYWNYQDFLGISLSASSKIGNIRTTNTRNFNEYFNDYNAYDEEITLTSHDLQFENIMMSLRTIYGLNIDEFNNKYNCDLLNDYKKGIANPNIVIDDKKIYCNNLAILNNVLLDFMD